MGKRRHFSAYIGMAGGGPDVENCQDEIGGYHAVQIFRTLEEAQARYADVRRVDLTIHARSAVSTGNNAG